MRKPPEISDDRIAQRVTISCRNREGRAWNLYRADGERAQWSQIASDLEVDETTDYDVTDGPSYKYRAKFIEDEVERSPGQAAYTRGSNAGASLPFPPDVANGTFEVDEVTDMWCFEDLILDIQLLWLTDETWETA